MWLSECKSCFILCYAVKLFIGPVLEYCCYGYAMDLLVQLANSVNFTFDLHLVEDGIYGTYERVNTDHWFLWSPSVYKQMCYNCTLYQLSLMRILNVCWYQSVSNRERWRITEQPPLTSFIQKTCLMLFGHLARMDESADAGEFLPQQFLRVTAKGRQDVLTPPGWPQ